MRMRACKIALLIVVTILALVGCTSTRNPTPADFAGHDFFVYRNVVYLNMSDTWFNCADFEKAEFIGEIRRTGVERRFRDFDATVLPIGTRIYHARLIGTSHDLAGSSIPWITFAIYNGITIPYLPMVEG